MLYTKLYIARNYHSSTAVNSRIYLRVLILYNVHRLTARHSVLFRQH